MVVGDHDHAAVDADRLYDFEFTKTFQHDPAVIPYEWDPNVFGLCIYPPFFVWVCLPFSYLPYHAGAIVWAIAMTACFLAALVLLLRSVPRGLRYFGLALFACLPTITPIARQAIRISARRCPQRR